MTRVVLDRPLDHQIWDRAELLAGWIEGVEGGRGLRLTCGGTELTVGECPHPRALGRSDVHGFWTELVVQRHLDTVEHGMLGLEIWRDDHKLAAIPLWVSPSALELARSHPLDLAHYPLPAAPPGATATTLVFPGLGAVGGSSLQRLWRSTMLRRGWATPVYDEASTPAVWMQLRATPWAARFRWIDGHGCYDTVEGETGQAARVTLLRDPIRRIVSVYNYGVLVHPETFGGVTFDQFVAAGGARRYSQAAGLLRIGGRDPERIADAATLERAARSELASSYALVGVSELFEETIFLLARLGGYDGIGMWRRVLAAPPTVDARALGAATRRQLAEDLAADLALYEDARAALLPQVAAAGGLEWVRHYRTAAACQPELSVVAKAVECLRWRQLLDAYRVASDLAVPEPGCAA